MLFIRCGGHLEAENLGRTVIGTPGDLIVLAPTKRNVLRISETVTYRQYSRIL